LTTETGTGLFHTARSNWLEDFFVGQNFGLEIPKTFGQSSLFQTSVSLFAEENVYTVNPQITEVLEQRGGPFKPYENSPQLSPILGGQKHPLSTVQQPNDSRHGRAIEDSPKSP
jgi:hypothetical protein